MYRFLISSVVALNVLLFSAMPAQADERKKFSVCWSIYVGWMPWEYGAQSGIVKKWADKYDIEIDVVQINDYIESINQYTAGKFDGCTMTNMDALTIPAASGVDSTALIVGDFSNGNDGIILKGKKELKEIKGQSVNLVELSVSHYLLARALDSVGMSEKDIKVVNTSDADLVAAYASGDVSAVVTWNPLLSEITSMPESNLVYDSSKAAGEIIDMMVVNTKTLSENPKLGKALTGAWYEIMGLMKADSKDGKTVRQAMGKASGTDLAGYEAQLKSTQMFYDAKDAVSFINSGVLSMTMKNVAEFSFKHGLLGEGAKDATFIGVETPSGVYGSDKNVKLRFTPDYMKMAAEGKL